MTTQTPSTPLVLEVTERIRESRNVLSLRLKVVEGALAPFIAGQYLPLRLGLPDRPISTYTISSDPADNSGYRISVKLEPEGKGGSRYLHQNAHPGTRLNAERPRGTFTLTEGDRPVVLLTGGIGITPGLAMLKTLIRQPNRPTYFIHACLNAEEHSFAEEVAALTGNAPHVTTHFAYADGTEADVQDGRCQSLGLLDRDRLRRLLPLDSYLVYLCGPEGFMTAMRKALVSLGVPDRNIHQESFGDAAPASPAAKPTGPDGVAATDGPMIHFAKSGLSVVWDGSSNSLLDFAEANGLSPEFECRDGICGQCACEKLEGDITYIEEPLESPEDGKVLICCSRPSGSVTLDL